MEEKSTYCIGHLELSLTLACTLLTTLIAHRRHGLVAKLAEHHTEDVSVWV